MAPRYRGQRWNELNADYRNRSRLSQAGAGVAPVQEFLQSSCAKPKIAWQSCPVITASARPGPRLQSAHGFQSSRDRRHRRAAELNWREMQANGNWRTRLPL
jgi:hypothetical protein